MTIKFEKNELSQGFIQSVLKEPAMKTRLLFSLGLLSFIMGCKDDDGNAHANLKGIYVGGSAYHSIGLEEIFTSPDMSHFEWVADSTFQDPDTLAIVAFAVDSFVLDGHVASSVPDYLKRFSWSDAIPDGNTITFSNALGSLDYAEHLTLEFIKDGSQVKLDYGLSTPNRTVSLEFQGGK